MRLIKPKAEEIFLQTVSMWVFQLKFSSIDTPRDFVDILIGSLSNDDGDPTKTPTE